MKRKPELPNNSKHHKLISPLMEMLPLYQIDLKSTKSSVQWDLHAYISQGNVHWADFSAMLGLSQHRWWHFSAGGSVRIHDEWAAPSHTTTELRNTTKHHTLCLSCFSSTEWSSAVVDTCLSVSVCVLSLSMCGHLLQNTRNGLCHLTKMVNRVPEKKETWQTQAS